MNCWPAYLNNSTASFPSSTNSYSYAKPSNGYNNGVTYTSIPIHSNRTGASTYNSSR